MIGTTAQVVIFAFFSFAGLLHLQGKQAHALNFRISSCPCSDEALCDPITDTKRKEVFAFSLRNDYNHWSKFDWSKLTTVVMTGYVNDSLMCIAHALNTRVSYIANANFDFTNPMLRKDWIDKQVDLMQEHYLDGINFDYESVIAESDNLKRDAYTSLVAETNAAVKNALPYSQVTVDVAWKQNIDIRFYDYVGLANHSDFLFVMAYDEQSQIHGECLAMPNSGAHRAVEGLTGYLRAGIQGDKLVLGLPWYGYIYPCTEVDGDKCHLKQVPFRGVNCSDAAGREYDYSYIKKLTQSHPVKWNLTSSTPYFTYTENSVSYQVQYDNPKSLEIKYAFAAAFNLRGVGMWNIDSLDYDDSELGRQCRLEMFNALPSYKSPPSS